MLGGAGWRHRVDWFGFKWRNNLNFFFFWSYHMACGILVPSPGIKPGPLELVAWSPNHLTTREFQQLKLYLSMAVLGLCCSLGFISSCGEQGLHSCCGARASRCSGFSCSGARVLERAGFSSCSMWDLPRPGIEPLSPALAGWFFSAEPPEKPPTI